MLHTWHTKSNAAGLTDPPGKDVEPFKEDKSKGKAYDPARAKYLAKCSRGGMSVALRNVDNIVYYALFKFVRQRWGIEANEPPSAWDDKKYLEHPEYINGVTTVSSDGYETQINETLLDISDREWFGGRPCTTNEDCNKACPLIYKSQCDNSVMQCVCLFKLDSLPPS